MVKLRFWQPQKTNQLWLTVLVIIILAAALIRLIHLGEIPHGMTWDEAAIGYNGHAVITTRRDEWLQKLPVSFQSFGDYKAPAAIYINGLFTTLLGMELWVVRLPFALSGVVGVIAFGWVVYELAKPNEKRWQVLLGIMLITTVPWHVHYSRIGFESGLALTMFLLGLGIVLYLLPRFKDLSFIKRLVLLSAAVILWAMSFYTYHSVKIFMPLFILWFAWRYREWIGSYWRWMVGILVLGLVLLLPLIQDTIYGLGATRASVLITSQGLKTFEVVQLFISNLVAHLDPRFLVMGQTESFRHGSGVWGVLSPATFLLSLAGLVGLISILRKSYKKNRADQLLIFGVIITLLGLIPAALSAEGAPHSNRALFALPGILMLAVSGAGQLVAWMSTKYPREVAFRFVVGLTVLIEVLSFVAYWHYYTQQYSVVSAADFQDGYLEAFEYAQQYERGLNGFPEVDKILFTDTYGQPYIFALFVRETSPIAYRGGSLYKYEFSSSISVSDLERNNTLVISAPQPDIDPSQAEHLVFGSDGELRFVINYTGAHDE